MKHKIHFSGRVGKVPSLPILGSYEISGIVQEFFHYLGKIWLAKNTIPHTVEDITKFDIRIVIDDYRKFRSSGGKVPIDNGLDLEQSYFVTQILGRTPLVCFLNSEWRSLCKNQLIQLRSLPPNELVTHLQNNYRINLVTQRDITGQIRRWEGLCPSYIALVYDGEIGHCIIIIGLERDSRRIIYWDPWPLLSLLCRQNNKAGVAAQPVSSGEPYWTIDAEEAEKVLVAVFIPEN